MPNGRFHLHRKFGRGHYHISRRRVFVDRLCLFYRFSFVGIVSCGLDYRMVGTAAEVFDIYSAHSLSHCLERIFSNLSVLVKESHSPNVCVRCISYIDCVFRLLLHSLARAVCCLWLLKIHWKNIGLTSQWNPLPSWSNFSRSLNHHPRTSPPIRDTAWCPSSRARGSGFAPGSPARPD